MFNVVSRAISPEQEILLVLGRERLLDGPVTRVLTVLFLGIQIVDVVFWGTLKTGQFAGPLSVC